MRCAPCSGDSVRSGGTVCPKDSTLNTMLVIAGLAVMLVLTLKVADRSYHRNLPSMWDGVGAAPGRAEAAPPLDDPRPLQLMAALGASQEARAGPCVMTSGSARTRPSNGSGSSRISI